MTETVAIVTPTYNESKNLPILISQIMALSINLERIIIVDDNSPDGTGKIAENLAVTNPIIVIHRKEKRGLGPAYIAGFREALKTSAKYIIQLDADLSHDVGSIPALIKSMKSADVVLASRYITGGKIENWGMLRRLISRWSNIFAQYILSLTYRDLTGGFKCWNRRVLESIQFDHISSIGYNFQIEMTYRAHKSNYLIKEVPTTFRERKTGVSKFNIGIIFESFYKVILLRFRN